MTLAHLLLQGHMFLSGIGLNVRTTMAVGRQVKEEGCPGISTFYCALQAVFYQLLAMAVYL